MHTNKKTNFKKGVVKTLATLLLLKSTNIEGKEGTTKESVHYKTETRVPIKEKTIDASTNYIMGVSGTEKLFNYDKIEIKTQDDLERLFNMALPIIYCELVLEELPMKTAYDDGGKRRNTKNTVGLGSVYAPLKIDDYKKKGVEWYLISKNPKNFWNRKYSYTDMAKLVIGWAYRTKTQKDEDGTKFSTTKSVLDRMFVRLKGATLRPNEFAALFCACYNNENNIAGLCPFIQQNWKNPVKCANEIMGWSENQRANKGTVNRCVFEALVYANCDNFCESMMEMQVCPKKKATCIYAFVKKTKQSNVQGYKTYTNTCKKKYLGQVYKNGAIRVKDIIYDKNEKDLKKLLNWGSKADVNTVDKDSEKLQKAYDAAQKLYDKKEYNSALDGFLSAERDGAIGSALYNDIAITYYNLQNYESCIEYCNKVLETAEEDEYAKACYNAGMAYEAQNDLIEALFKYEEAKGYYGEHGIADAVPGVEYEKIYTNAIQKIDDAITGALYNEFAISYYKMGQYDKCIKCCQKVLKKKNETNEYAKACYNAGMAYEKKKDLGTALNNYEEAKKCYGKYGIANPNKDVDYLKIYNDAITRVRNKIERNEIKQNKITPPRKGQNTR